MHRTLTLLALSGLVAACGSGSAGTMPRTDDQAPSLNGDAPPNYSEVPAASDQAPLNDTEQPRMNDQAPGSGVCAGTTTPLEYLNILRRVSCAQANRCPAGPEGVSYWSFFCEYVTGCAADPGQCDITLEESIPVCPAGLESCILAAADYLGCDTTGDALEELDWSQVPACAGIFEASESEPPPEPDPITDDVNGFGGASG